MPFCSFAEGASMFGVTPIENMFLIEYLYDAPAPALKVYLYARMLALYPELGGSLADMAKALRMEEDAVREAFDYWERHELARRVSDNPPAYELIALNGQGGGAASAMDRRMYAYRDFHNRLQTLFGEKMIGDHEYRKAGDWLNILGFDQEAVVRIVAYGIATSRSKSPGPASVFKRMDDFAERLSKQGMRSLEDVERAIADEEEIAPIAREALKKLGIPRQPSVPELDSVRRWVKEWGFDRAQILAACDETTKSRNPSFAYLEGILQNRRSGEDGVRRAVVELLRELRPGSAQPSPEDIKRYQALRAEGFSPDLIQLAAVQCHQKNQHAFENLEWRLSLWREEGLQTAEQAEAYTRQMAGYARQLRGLFKRAGYPDRNPSLGAIKRYRTWRENHSEELIGFAAECAQSAGGSMAYMEKLLDAWQRDGVSTVEAARVQHEAWRAAAAAQATGGAPANPALNYAQREYRDEDFGDDFFEDLTKYVEEGDRT